MLVVAIIVGALLGGFLSSGPGGAVTGAVLAWLVMRVNEQAQRMAALQRAVQALQAGPTPGASPAADGAGAHAAPGPVTPTEVDPAEVDPAAESWRRAPTASAPREELSAPSIEQPPRHAPLAAGPSLPARLKAWFFGGNTIAKAGVGILFIGLAFLAKYAAEHTHVPVEVRLGGIAAVALALLGLGWRLRHARPAYAQALQGGAVAVLYLTLFVAFRFYGVLAVGPVFAAMVVVAALAAALAVLQDARTLAVIGALGGFATPLLVSSGSGDHVALFSYYLVLDLGIAAVAWFKTWRLLNLVGFVFTFAVGGLWGLNDYGSAQYASSQAFLIAFFLLFNAVLMMPARRLVEQPALRSDTWVNGSLLFGLPIVSFALQHGLVRHTAYGTALSALVMAAFYVGMASRMKRHPQLAITFDASLAIAIVMLSLVVPFALDTHSTAGAWALEAAGLLWLGLRQGRRLPRGFAYLLLVLASGALMLATAWQPVAPRWFNAALMNALLLAAGALAGAFFVQRHARQGGVLMRGETAAEPALITLATLWLLHALWLQIERYVGVDWTVTAVLAGLSAMALLYTALAQRLQWPRIALPTLAFTPLLFVQLGVSVLALRTPSSFGGWWAWPLALATHAVLLRWATPHWPAAARTAVHTLGLLVLAGLGALQSRALTHAWGDLDSAWPWLGFMAAPALLLALLPRPGTARRWPVSADPHAYQALGGAMLMAALLVWTVLANVMSDGTAAPLPHVPLLNPLDLGIAAALGAAWLWQRSAPAQAALQGHPLLPAALLGGSAFVWLNAMLVRGFHHYGGVPYRVHAWTASLAVQTGLTLLWSATALALMWLSARRGLRLVWMVGAALLAVVVLKLLLVDLSGSGTVTRIVSFIGVGLLMLVIAYVAPLPASETEHAAP